MFSKDGAVGSMFNGELLMPNMPLQVFEQYGLISRCAADGALGGTAQKVGGPFDKQGSVGQHFNANGKIGGMVQKNLAENK